MPQPPNPPSSRPSDVAAKPETPPLRGIPAQEYRRTRWRNGSGWTREILQWPESGDWDWRASVAEIDADAAFSVFPGVERSLVLLHGEGLRLHVGDGAAASAVEPPHGRCDFPGDRAVRAALHAGPVHVFNLMWRRSRIRAELWRRPLVGSMVLFATPDEQWLVHVLAGHAAVGDVDGVLHLSAADSALIAPCTARRRTMIEGGGDLLLARMRPAENAEAELSG